MNGNLQTTAAGGEQSLRGFLETLNEDRLWRLCVKREDYLLSALVERLEAKKRFPVLLLTDPDTGERTVANTFANRDILKAVLFHLTNTEEAAESFKTLEMLETGPVQEIRLTGSRVNLLSLPVYRHFEGDAGRYITSGIVLAKDPESGRYNMSFHRMQLKGKDRIGISLHSRGDLYRYLEASRARKQDLEVAVIIGCHPAYYITGASKIPLTQDDYSWAGAYMNETPKVVRAVTVDLLVPAFAEVVLEGKILVNVLEDEGPFGEYTGYSTSRSTRNVLEITAITRRRDAIWQDLVPGYAWEHLLLSQFSKEINLLAKLQKEVPEVCDLNLPKNGCHFHAYVSLKSKAFGQAKQVMLLLFGLDIYLKMIVVVGEDVDVYNEEEVLWAVATHVQADKDVFIVPGVLCNRLDPSSRDGVSAKMGIDATGFGQEEAERVHIPKEAKRMAEDTLRNCRKGG